MTLGYKCSIVIQSRREFMALPVYHADPGYLRCCDWCIYCTVALDPYSAYDTESASWFN